MIDLPRVHCGNCIYHHDPLCPRHIQPWTIIDSMGQIRFDPCDSYNPKPGTCKTYKSMFNCFGVWCKDCLNNVEEWTP